MSPRDVYMLGFTLSCVSLLAMPVLMIGEAIFPSAVDLSYSGPFTLWMLGFCFLGGFIRWLARCNACGLGLIWRYDPKSVGLLRYTSVAWLPPKTCSRCGDLLE